MQISFYQYENACIFMNVILGKTNAGGCRFYKNDIWQ